MARNRLTPVVPLLRPVRLTTLPCRHCGAIGVTLVAFTSASEGDALLCWCCPEHAKQDGWPFIAGAKRVIGRLP